MTSSAIQRSLETRLFCFATEKHKLQKHYPWASNVSTHIRTRVVPEQSFKVNGRNSVLGNPIRDFFVVVSA